MNALEFFIRFGLLICIFGVGGFTGAYWSENEITVGVVLFPALLLSALFLWTVLTTKEAISLGKGILYLGSIPAGRSEMTTKKTMSPEEFLVKMKNIDTIADIEQRHKEADNLLCELLKQLGYNEGIEIFHSMKLWYS